MPCSTYKSRPRGFTFVELMLGLVVTSIVLGALGAFTYSVGENWTASDTSQSVFLTADIGVDRLTMLVRSAQMVDPNPTNGSLDNSTAPATCMVWTDTNGDGLIQYSEMTLLQYDQADQRLMQYSIPATANNAGTQSATLMSATSFLALPNLVATPIVHDVSACQIFSNNAGGTTPRPSLEFVLQMQAGNGSSKTMVYATATVRAPSNPT